MQRRQVTCYFCGQGACYNRWTPCGDFIRWGSFCFRCIRRGFADDDDDEAKKPDKDMDIDDLEELFEVTAMCTADDDECQKLNETDGEPKDEEELDWSKVLDARCEEIEFLKRKGIYTKVPRSQCLAASNRRQFGGWTWTRARQATEAAW